VDELLPRLQGTPGLASFLHGYGPLSQTDQTIYALIGLNVQVTASVAADCDSDWTTFQAGSRGLLLQTGLHDLTLVGVGYTAVLQSDTRSWKLRVERGAWNGDDWQKSGEPLPGTVSVDSATGFLTLTFPPEDRVNQDASLLQVVLRVFDEK